MDEGIMLILLGPFYVMAVAATGYVVLRLISSATEIGLTETLKNMVK
jgi:hypothetical protein